MTEMRITDGIKLAGMLAAIFAGAMVDGSVSPPIQSAPAVGELTTALDPDANPWSGLCHEDEVIVTVTDSLAHGVAEGSSACVAADDLRDIGDTGSTGSSTGNTEPPTVTTTTSPPPTVTDPDPATERPRTADNPNGWDTFDQCADHYGYSDSGLADCADSFDYPCGDPRVDPYRKDC